jgi:hypothetical protein
MAIVTQSAQSQSSSALNGQSTTYIKGLCLMQLSGAPDTLVDTILQQVIREFYTLSGSWRDIIGPYNVVVNVDEIQFNPIDQFTSLLNVYSAFLFPSPGSSNTRQWLYLSPDKVVGVDRGPVSTLWMRTPDIGVLYPKPDISYGASLYLLAALKPVINTTQLPNISTEQHLDGLVSGVLSRMYAIPKRPWSDAAAAAMHSKTYRREILLARDQANRSYSSADSRRVFPPFAGRGSQRLSRVF